MTLEAALLARVERLRDAMPPPELCAADVDEQSQLDLTLALLDLAAAAGRREEAA